MSVVSVIMPCYNASAYISKAIESVLAQTYTDWELLVVDDGSKDGSPEIAKAYEKKDLRIHLIEQSNSGACVARNRGLQLAKGEYVKYFDADDILDPNCLKEQVEQIERLQPHQIPFGYYHTIDDQDRLIDDNPYSEDILKAAEGDSIVFIYRYWQMLTSCPLHRRKMLDAIGGFDPLISRGQETDLHFRLALAGAQFIYFPTLCYQYRQYQSEARISSNFSPQTAKFRENYVELMRRREEQLLEHFGGELPKRYHHDYANYWFEMARMSYAKRDVEAGAIAMKKAQNYGLYKPFQRFYHKTGSIIGFVLLEWIFQLRLKLMRKK